MELWLLRMTESDDCHLWCSSEYYEAASYRPQLDLVYTLPATSNGATLLIRHFGFRR